MFDLNMSRVFLKSRDDESDLKEIGHISGLIPLLSARISIDYYIQIGKT